MESVKFSEAFHKSRGRLITFSLLGILVCVFPFDPDSALFGLKFDGGISALSVMWIFNMFTGLLFVERIVRVVEEEPVVFGKHATAHERYVRAEKALEELQTQAEGRLDQWTIQTENLESTIDDVHEFILQNSQTNSGTWSTQSGQTTKDVRDLASHIQARTGEMREVIKHIERLKEG